MVDEKEPSFIWVLEQSVEVGEGLGPLTILTDGDKAMANAINVIFPKAQHRLCLWLIMRNIRGMEVTMLVAASLSASTSIELQMILKEVGLRTCTMIRRRGRSILMWVFLYMLVS